MNLANFLTTVRIILTPFCILFIVWDGPYNRLIAFGLFILAFLTDAFDGYLARTRNEITEFGKFFDPLADKILTISILISLAFKINEAWCWLAVGVICVREIVIAMMRRWRAPQGVCVASNNYGKFKTVVQAIAVGALIIEASIASYLLWAAVLFSVYSGIHYVTAWREKRHISAQAITEK